MEERSRRYMRWRREDEEKRGKEEDEEEQEEASSRRMPEAASASRRLLRGGCCEEASLRRLPHPHLGCTCPMGPAGLGNTAGANGHMIRLMA